MKKKTIRWNNTFIVKVRVYDGDTDINALNKNLNKAKLSFTTTTSDRFGFNYSIEATMKTVGKIYRIVTK